MSPRFIFEGFQIEVDGKLSIDESYLVKFFDRKFSLLFRRCGSHWLANPESLQSSYLMFMCYVPRFMLDSYVRIIICMLIWVFIFYYKTYLKNVNVIKFKNKLWDMTKTDFFDTQRIIQIFLTGENPTKLRNSLFFDIKLQCL